MEWNPVTETLHRAVHGDREFLVWTEPDSWAWAVIRLTVPNPETQVVIATGEAASEKDAKAKAETHVED